MNFSQAPTHPDQILRLIARVPSGREILSEFLPLYRSGRVRFEHYEPTLLERLRDALGEGQPVGACFINDGVSGSIHYDPAAPLGVLAAFLVHEMVHALDTRHWAASTMRQTREERDHLMLAAESRAFDVQHRFVEELRAAEPAYSEFIQNEQSRVRVLHEKLSEQSIAEIYGFKH